MNMRLSSFGENQKNFIFRLGYFTKGILKKEFQAGVTTNTPIKG